MWRGNDGFGVLLYLVLLVVLGMRSVTTGPMGDKSWGRFQGQPGLLRERLGAPPGRLESRE